MKWPLLLLGTSPVFDCKDSQRHVQGWKNRQNIFCMYIHTVQFGI